ncbi:hypothetical protein DL766_007584 [Monosporascus sp. MC13-8B]|uniref:DUF7580 domain-containing protein n=1 Tax=Monosporascus cannonballus TaxID=155416 RepID=A0ABY0HJJ9_9PEZI|nr:hypothetical protein DL763_008203 [Monosporascus cannonballus]RYO94559.1 hypothetical protein DL762_000451 [Monosporascus cannonballus]RYP22991.1 hypothetical protein DL766_007584 [Monosporascus sp. MC13-8B]
MSGLEVVGLVLGTIPLIISAIEHYERVIETIHIMRRRAKVMHSLARSLSTEQRILENTCETLLGGIVPADDIKPLLAEPFGTLWQDDKIRLEVERRLDHTATDFEGLVKDMMEALQELRIKLDLGSGTRVIKDESTAGKREVLKFAAIALKISQHEDAVNKIADTNQKLERLLAGNLRNEPIRKQSSKGRLFSLLQAVAWSIYNALRLSLSCSCAQLHSVNLALPAPQLTSKTQDEESVVRKLDFHLAFVNKPQDFKGKGHRSWVWDEVLLRMADWPTKVAPAQSAPAACPMLEARKSKVSKRVRFGGNLPLSSSMQSPSETVTYTTTQLTYIFPKLALQVGDQDKGQLIRTGVNSTEPLQLANLCDTFARTRQNLPSTGIYGYVVDNSPKSPRRFGVYYLKSSDDSDAFLTVSLKDLLDRRLRPPPLSRRHRMAAMIAASILNLHSTPWIPLALTSKDLYFVQRHGKIEYDEVFVTREFADDISVASDAFCDALNNFDGNPSLHALGVLLMEVMLWKSIHDFWDDGEEPECADIPSHVLLNVRSANGFKRTSSVLERVGFSGGLAYREAVEHCIKCDLQCDNESLDDEEFRDAVYHHVVAPLHDAAQITTAPMTAGRGQFARTA